MMARSVGVGGLLLAALLATALMLASPAQAASVSSADYLSAPAGWALRAARAEERKNAMSRALMVVPQPAEYAALQMEQAAQQQSLLSAREQAETEAKAKAVSICMNVLDEEIDIPQMKKLEKGIKAALAETKEALKQKPKSKFLNAKLKCLKAAEKFHGKALATISDQVAKAKAIEKDADKCEVDLLNLPCDLEEGDHVDKCDALKCRKKGLRKRERNAKEQAKLWYRMKTLDLRVYRFQSHIAKIKKNKACPRRRVDVYHHRDGRITREESSGDAQPRDSERDSSFAEVDAQRGGKGERGHLLWEEDWMMCLDRAEARVDQIRFQIKRMKERVGKLASMVIPLTCSEKAKEKQVFPPRCPKPPLPPPPPLPKVYKVVAGKFSHARATASGDPHVDTFDGVHHDTMVAGWFTWAKNPVIHVQGYSQLGCMPANVPNTCLRAFSLKIVPPGSDEWLTMSWGVWPPQNHVQNVVVADSFGKKVDTTYQKFPAGLYLGGKFHISFSGRRVTLRPNGKAVTDPNMSITFSYGDYFMQLMLPRHAPHFGTNGLFGYMNDPNTPKTIQNQLRFLDGTPSKVDQKALCQRCGWSGMQTPQIFEWAATHVVTSEKGKNPPISTASQGGLKQQKYLNAHHQNKAHKTSLLQLSALTQLDMSSAASSAAAMNLSLASMHTAHLTAEQRADLQAALHAEFSPVPVGNKAKTFPSVVPKANREDLVYCRLRLKKIFKLDKLKKDRKEAEKKGWWHGKKCLSEAEHKKIEEMLAARKEKVKKEVARYHENLNACLQDVKSQAVAKTVINAQKLKKKEKAKAKTAQKKELQKKEAKKRAIKRAIKAQKREQQKALDPNAVAKAQKKAQKAAKAAAHEEHEHIEREMKGHKRRPKPCPMSPELRTQRKRRAQAEQQEEEQGQGQEQEGDNGAQDGGEQQGGEEEEEGGFGDAPVAEGQNGDNGQDNGQGQDNGNAQANQRPRGQRRGHRQAERRQRRGGRRAGNGNGDNELQVQVTQHAQ